MRGVRWVGCLLLLSLLCGTVARGAEANAMRAPKSLSRPAQAPAVPPAVSLPAGVFDRLLRFFQLVISPVDGARSNMYPTGSAYARQVIQKHGALLGIMLTTERLMHEGNEGKVSPRIQKHGVWRIYDPVEANDWWWHHPDDWVYIPHSTPVQIR